MIPELLRGSPAHRPPPASGTCIRSLDLLAWNQSCSTQMVLHIQHSVQKVTGIREESFSHRPGVAEHCKGLYLSSLSSSSQAPGTWGGSCLLLSPLAPAPTLQPDTS